MVLLNFYVLQDFITVVVFSVRRIVIGIERIVFNDRLDFSKIFSMSNMMKECK